MFNWSERFGEFLSRIIDWGGSGFRGPQEPVAHPVLTGYLISKSKTGNIVECNITGLLSKNEFGGQIVNTVTGTLSKRDISGVITIKK